MKNEEANIESTMEEHDLLYELVKFYDENGETQFNTLIGCAIGIISRQTYEDYEPRFSYYDFNNAKKGLYTSNNYSRKNNKYGDWILHSYFNYKRMKSRPEYLMKVYEKFEKEKEKRLLKNKKIRN